MTRCLRATLVRNSRCAAWTCAGATLSEWKSDLATWFVPDEQLVLYRNSAELLAAVDRLARMSDKQLQEMGRAARDTVMSRHRLTQRVDAILQVVDAGSR